VIARRGNFAPYNRRKIELSVLDSVMWISMIAFPYNTIYLSEIGLSSSTIGIVVALSGIASIVMQPLWGNISDSKLGVRKTLLIVVAMSSAMTLFMVVFKSAALIISAFVLRAFSVGPILTLIDNYIVEECAVSGKKMNYGNIRLWGSAAFAAGAAAIGVVSQIYGLRSIFAIQAGLMALLIVAVIKFVPETGAHINEQFDKVRKKGFNRDIFTKAFIVFVIILFISMIPDTAANTFFPLAFKAAGGSLYMLGLGSSLRAVIEIPFFKISGRIINKLGSLIMVFVAIGLNAFRMLGFVFFKDPNLMFVTNLIAAPSYVLLTTGMLHYVYEIAPEGSKSTAQMIVSSLCLSLTGVLSSSTGGYILESFGFSKMALGGFVIIVFALFFMAAMQRKTAAQKEKDRL
jgi:PPP family 3-phenylpropionic acid transporter